MADSSSSEVEVGPYEEIVGPNLNTNGQSSLESSSPRQKWIRYDTLQRTHSKMQWKWSS